MRDKALSILTLYTSSGTLLCCVLPAIVATIAGGVAVGSMLSTFPWLIHLSKNKDLIFAGAGVLIALNGYMIFKPSKELACDIDEGEVGCEITGKFNKRMFYTSAIVFLTGGFFAYALVPILELLHN